MYANEESNRPGTVVCDGEVSCDDESIVCNDGNAVESTIQVVETWKSSTLEVASGSDGGKSDENSPMKSAIGDSANVTSLKEVFDGDSVHSEPDVEDVCAKNQESNAEIVTDSDKDEIAEQTNEFPNNQFTVYDNCEADMGATTADMETTAAEMEATTADMEATTADMESATDVPSSETLVKTSDIVDDPTNSAQVDVGDGKFITIPKVGGSECYVLVTVLPADQTGESVMHVYKLNPSDTGAAGSLETTVSATDADKTHKDPILSVQNLDSETENCPSVKQTIATDAIQPLQSVNIVQQEVEKNVKMFSNFAVVSRSVSESLGGFTEMDDSESSSSLNCASSDHSKVAINTLPSPAHSASESDVASGRSRRTSLSVDCTGSQSDLSDGLSDEIPIDLSISKKQSRTMFTKGRSMSPLIIVPDDTESVPLVKSRDCKISPKKTDFTSIREKSKHSQAKPLTESEVIEIDDSSYK